MPCVARSVAPASTSAAGSRARSDTVTGNDPPGNLVHGVTGQGPLRSVWAHGSHFHGEIRAPAAVRRAEGRRGLDIAP